MDQGRGFSITAKQQKKTVEQIMKNKNVDRETAWRTKKQRDEDKYREEQWTKQEKKTKTIAEGDKKDFDKIKEKMRDPNLLIDVVREVQKEVAGEEDTILAEIIVATTRLVSGASPESKNLFLSDKTGIGKDFTTSKTLEVIIPEDDNVHVTKMSKEAFTYWHNNESEWNWDEKVIHFEDITQSLLNCSTFKVMSSGGSYAVVVKDQTTIEIPINGKPCMILTSHHANPEDEALRRFPIGALNDSKEQTKRIKDKVAKRYTGREIISPDYTIRSAVQSLDPHSVIIPFAELIQFFFPEDVIMRTHFRRFLDYICSSAIFHQHQREKTDDGKIITTPDDYMIARMALIYTTSNPKMIPMSKEYRDVLTILQEDVQPMTVNDIFLKCDGHSKKWLYTHLPKIAATKLIERGKQLSKDANREIETYQFADINPHAVPTWDKILSEMNKVIENTENTENTKTNTTEESDLEKWFLLNKKNAKKPKSISAVLHFSGGLKPFNRKVFSVFSKISCFLRERDEKRYKKYYEEPEPTEETPDQDETKNKDEQHVEQKTIKITEETIIKNDSTDFRNKYGKPLDQEFFNEYYNMNFGESEDKIYGDLVITGLLDFMTKDELRSYVKNAMDETGVD